MAVVLVFEGITQQQYEEVVRKMSGKDRMESASDWPVPGLLAHAAGQVRTAFGGRCVGV
jgi:hypothetical protein